MDNESLISVIIPSLNRYDSLLRAIKSVQNQTYKNIEIIIIIDGPTDYPEISGVNTIQLPENSTTKFGYPCPGFCRTMGILNSRGKYVCFLDDDDEFINKNKLSLQIEAMKRTRTRMSCSEALTGNEVYDPSKTYKKYNLEKCYRYISSVFHRKNKKFNGFPELFNLEYIQTNNSIITSTVIMERTLLDEIGYMPFLQYGAEIPEDYSCWLSALRHTKCVYISEPCTYYYNHIS